MNHTEEPGFTIPTGPVIVTLGGPGPNETNITNITNQTVSIYDRLFNIAFYNESDTCLKQNRSQGVVAANASAVGAARNNQS